MRHSARRRLGATFRTRVAALAVALIAILAVAAPAQPAASAPLDAPSDGTSLAAVRGDVDDFTFSSFDGEYTLGRDSDGHSTLRSVETFVAEFPQFDQNRGIIRRIPEGSRGVNWKTNVESVTDAQGNPVPYEEETEDNFIVLALGTDEFVRGSQTYVITYTQRDVVRSFAGTDIAEFYWDAPGTGFAQRFDSARMRVVMPEELASEVVRSACYQGTYGSDDQCVIERSETGSTVEFASAEQQLGPGGNITLALGFSPGTFATPPVPSTWPIFTVVPAALALALIGVLIATFISRRRSTPDAPGRGTIIVQYSAPRGLDLFVAADVIGKLAQAMPATLISLAVRGYLRIIDEPSTFGRSHRFSLQLASRSGRGTDPDDVLSPSELSVLTTLFGANGAPGATRDIDAKDTALAKEVVELKRRAPQQSVAAGLRVKKRVSGARIFVLSALALVVSSGILTIVGTSLYAGNPWLIGGLVVSIVAAVATFICATARLALTPRGAELRDHLIGLREYLDLAEEDRIRMLQSPSAAERVTVGDARNVVKLYEKLLPYAVLWGVEDDWSNVLGRSYENTGESPDWYSSSQGFSTGWFIGSMSSFSSTSGTGTPWASSAMSSATGGSGGGGFSGGGGGGGGGGGR